MESYGILNKFKNPQFVVDDSGHTLATGMMQHDAQMVGYCEVYGVHSITGVEWEVYLSLSIVLVWKLHRHHLE